jgi:amicyanin
MKQAGRSAAYIFGVWGVNSTLKFAQQQANGGWMYGNLSLNPGPNGTNVSGMSGTYIQSLGQDSKGEMYVLTTSNLQPLGAQKTGAVWMLVPPGGNQTSNQSSNQSSGATPAPSTNQSSQQNQSGASSSSAATIQNFAFSPTPLTVKVGTTVTWTNKDNVDHTVTTTSGPVMFDSKNIASGQTFSYTFTQAGTYNYICTIHPFMTGQVVVQ